MTVGISVRLSSAPGWEGGGPWSHRQTHEISKGACSGARRSGRRARVHTPLSSCVCVCVSALWILWPMYEREVAVWTLLGLRRAPSGEGFLFGTRYVALTYHALALDRRRRDAVIGTSRCATPPWQQHASLAGGSASTTRPGVGAVELLRSRPEGPRSHLSTHPQVSWSQRCA